jgi:hypothetical protein
MRKLIDKYSYQPKAAKAVLNMALNPNFIAAVLGAAPGSGKSTILIHALNEYFERYPDARAVILTHNQNILKDQMIENFENPNVEIKFTFGVFGSNSQVEIGIPSNSSKLSKMDLLVADEAHQYYWEPMVDAIVDEFSPTHQILMTGSPSFFVKYNKLVDKSRKTHRKFGIHFIAAGDLMNGVFSPIDLDVVRYDGRTLIDKIKAIFKKAKTEKYNMSKVMWACKNIKEAKATAYYLQTEFGLNVFISTSQNDKDNVAINSFKKCKNGVLLVVNKGILGFSDNTITSVVDFKCSKDLDTRNQFFSRGLRVHPEGIRKAYISVSNTKNWNKEGQILHQTVSLMDPEVFRNYDGTPLKNSMRAA